ncbi:conserved hypothetical protein [Mesorhizobium prunaredense]|uniref:Uncharacterized protein n=1 Tax=Mesorhizobium prunaredense TaxID=1631249 RepID=A0A1R3VJ63_9HYPH|nr:hypothetical protein [Mesorhizobium prunaredense]SIT59323.1 conserved hypothetical protein [Mesorhizobium prunaredense]
MALRIKLPGDRVRERERRVPVMKIGSLYFIWWSNSQPHNKPQDSHH